MSESNNAFAKIRDRAKARAAEHLLMAGAMLADQARADLSAGGQYPSVRSGKLRNAVTLSAYDPGQVAKDEYVVRVGLKKEAYYGAILFKKGWKGLADTMIRIRRELMKVIERGR